MYLNTAQYGIICRKSSIDEYSECQTLALSVGRWCKKKQQTNSLAFHKERFLSGAKRNIQLKIIQN